MNLLNIQNRHRVTRLISKVTNQTKSLSKRFQVFWAPLCPQTNQKETKATKNHLFYVPNYLFWFLSSCGKTTGWVLHPVLLSTCRIHCGLPPDSQRCSCVNTHTVDTVLHITKSSAEAAGVAASFPEGELACVQILLVLSVNSEETLQQPLNTGLQSRCGLLWLAFHFSSDMTKQWNISA